MSVRKGEGEELSQVEVLIMELNCKFIVHAYAGVQEKEASTKSEGGG